MPRGQSIPCRAILDILDPAPHIVAILSPLTLDVSDLVTNVMTILFPDICAGTKSRFVGTEPTGHFPEVTGDIFHTNPFICHTSGTLRHATPTFDTACNIFCEFQDLLE
jgi:hypothetical protein